MSVPAPHFLLFSECSSRDRQGDWRFVLQSVDGDATIEAADRETQVHGERLELLAVVRGLEALEQPSRVTLLTPSKYVHRGLNNGLEEWRSNGWQWESFGQMVPVKNQDLWRRIDRALEFHRVECRTWRVDESLDKTQVKGSRRDPVADILFDVVPLEVEPLPKVQPSHEVDAPQSPAPHTSNSQRKLRRWQLAARRAVALKLQRWGLKLSQLGTSLLPCPWLQ